MKNAADTNGRTQALQEIAFSNQAARLPVNNLATYPRTAEKLQSERRCLTEAVISAGDIYGRWHYHKDGQIRQPMRLA